MCQGRSERKAGVSAYPGRKKESFSIRTVRIYKYLKNVIKTVAKLLKTATMPYHEYQPYFTTIIS